MAKFPGAFDNQRHIEFCGPVLPNMTYLFSAGIQEMHPEMGGGLKLRTPPRPRKVCKPKKSYAAIPPEVVFGDE